MDPATPLDTRSELQRAGIAIRTLRARLEALEAAAAEPVAVVGVSCRLPGGCDGPEAYWRLLSEGADAVGDVPDGRWDKARYFEPRPGRPGTMYTQAGGFLDGIELFDAPFFGIIPREAQAMDPQQRLLLECAWEALENAGEHYERTQAAPVGVFLGITSGDYGMRVRDEAGPEYLDGHYLAGNPLNTAAGRLSYTFGFSGPCLAVDTACSSSLVALHLALRSLRARECAAALAAGVNILLCPKSTAMLCQASLISPSGRCRSFDAQADGMVRGEGCGVLVLKRLSDALAQGNHIHAVVRGSAVNQDGASSSLTAPNGRAQEAVIRAALADARLAPGDVDYVEAHGSATPLGDPVEVRSLSAVYGAGRDAVRPLWIGSVKANLGHLESAAGVAGVLKLILSLQHARLARQPHFTRPTPQVDWERTGVRVCDTERAWEREAARPRRAAVSGFGVSGTNAHVVLEEAPPAPAAGPAREHHALLLSAPTASGLEALGARLCAHLRRHPEQDFADVAYTLQTGRPAFAHRRAVWCAGRAEALELLAQSGSTCEAAGQVARGVQTATSFLFPAREQHYAGMGRGLHQHEPLFREEFERCVAALPRSLGLDAGALLEPPAVGAPGLPVEAAVFAVQYALGRLLMAWGLTPQAMLGVGAGTYVAACLAGVMELPLALAAALEGRRLDAPELGQPRVALVNARDGTRLRDEQWRDPDAWRRAAREPLTSAALEALAGDKGARCVIEIGGGPAAGACAARAAGAPLSALPPDARPAGEAAWLQRLLASAWVRGVAVDWRAVHSGWPRRKTPLPSYPFERQRYWIELRGAAAAPAAGAGEELKLPLERWFNVPTWTRREHVASEAALREPARALRWLVFSPGAADALGVVAQLEAWQAPVALVTPGAGFAQLGPCAFTLAAEQAADYTALVEALRRGAGLPDVVLDLGSLPAGGDAGPGEAALAAAESGFIGLVHLARALTAAQPDVRARLCVVTHNVHALTGAEAGAPEQALLLGPCTVIPQEYPGLTCVAVDVDLRPGAHVREQGLRLLAEACREPAERQVAYRERSRFARTFEPLACPAPTATPLRERGVYLISGGLGAVGLSLARELARRCRARLVLLGRGAPVWPAAAAEPGVEAATLDALRRIEADGAEVLALPADVTDAQALARAVAAARARFGPIQGAIHAAGLPGAGLIAAKTLADARRVFAPKVSGTLRLAEALHDEPLDFLLLCSSSISVLGGVGQSDYCAANAFLDAYAHQARAAGRPVVSVGWDLWQEDRWQERLLSGLPALLARLRELRARFGIRPDEAAQVLERLTAACQAHVVVATRAFEAQRRESAETTLDSLMAPGLGGRARRPRPELGVAYAAPEGELEQALAELWAGLLDLERVGAHDNYFDLGGDSLSGLQVTAYARQRFGIELQIHDIFAQPTVAGLALLIEERIVEHLEAAPSP